MAQNDIREVTANNVNVRTGPGTTFPVVNVFTKGTRFKQYSTSDDAVWIQFKILEDTRYISANYTKIVQVAPENKKPVTNTSNPTSSGVTDQQQKEINETSGRDTNDKTTGAYVNPDTILDTSNIQEFEQMIQDANNYNDIGAFIGTFGLPYQFLPTADPRINGANAYNNNSYQYLGATYAEKIASKMPLLFMAPGRPNFMTKFSEEDQTNILSQLVGGLVDKATVGLEDLIEGQGKYYTFDYDLKSYYNYVNPMCRIAARYLGINEETIDSMPLDTVDWSKYTSSHATGLMEKTEYMNIPFYIDSDVSVDESFGNSTGESSLASTINGVSDMARELHFLTGYSSAALDQDWFRQNADSAALVESINTEVEKILGHGGFLSNLSKHLATVASGGRLIFPKIWTDSDVSRSYRIKIKLVSPDCNKLSIFFNILVPLFHLIGFVAPQSIPTNPNGYTAPFIVRAIYKSFFNVDMGIITSMSVERGGNCMWTVDGIPTSIEVSFEIKDLYDVFAITPTASTDFRYDTMSNTAQMDYICNLCGINMYKPEIARQITMWLTNNVENRLLDFPRNIWKDLNQGIGKAILGIYRRGL